MEITLFSSHCPRCTMIEKILKDKQIEFELIEDSNIYLPIASEHEINNMPFAIIDNKVYDTKQLQEFIINLGGKQ